MPGSIKIDDGAGRYTILTNGGSLGSDKTITIPNTTGTMALTSDIPAATTPGLTKIADTDFSGASDATFDNVFTSTYRNYKAVISIKPANNNVALQFKVRDGSGDITSSNYAYKALYALNNNSNAFINGGAEATGTGGLITSGAAQNIAYHGFIDILEPNIADRTGLLGMQTGTGHLLIHSGSFNLTTQLTGIKFKTSSGNISGSIQIYGYAT